MPSTNVMKLVERLRSLLPNSPTEMTQGLTVGGGRIVDEGAVDVTARTGGELDDEDPDMLSSELNVEVKMLDGVVDSCSLVHVNELEDVWSEEEVVVPE